jgi:hypothetical protein
VLEEDEPIRQVPLQYQLFTNLEMDPSSQMLTCKVRNKWIYNMLHSIRVYTVYVYIYTLIDKLDSNRSSSRMPITRRLESAELFCSTSPEL